MIKNCLYCKKEFSIQYKSWSAKKFCSMVCKGLSQKNKPITEKQKQALSKGQGWNKGVKGLQSWHNISGLRPPKKGERLGVLAESKNPMWKGNNVGYFALHDWVVRNKGKASVCEFCKTKKAKRYEWANISGEYKRNLNDFISLCKKCHNDYDGVNAWQQKKSKV